jgi:hypothetical protein
MSSYVLDQAEQGNNKHQPGDNAHLPQSVPGIFEVSLFFAPSISHGFTLQRGKRTTGREQACKAHHDESSRLFNFSKSAVQVDPCPTQHVPDQDKRPNVAGFDYPEDVIWIVRFE